MRSQCSVGFLFVVTQGQRGRKGKSKTCDGGLPGTPGLKGKTVSVTHYWGKPCPILDTPQLLTITFNIVLNYQNILRLKPSNLYRWASALPAASRGRIICTGFNVPDRVPVL